MNKAYNVIPIDRLDMARVFLNAMLKQRGKVDGKRYGTRTFYLGPRTPVGSRRPGQTLKSDAYAAKIGVYEMRYDSYSNRYAPGNLLYYI